jgi:serine phosphatase RsbU (regulator of sigma subunit)
MLRMKRLYDSNRQLMEQLLMQKKVMDEELMMAATIQHAMLPSTNEAFFEDRCEIESYYRAATSIGGDFYDIFEYGENRLAFFIADVAGHGPSAALIVAMIKTILFNEKKDYPSPSLMMQRLNDKIIQIIEGGRFVTAFFCVADFNDKSLTYSSAGHPPPFLLRKNEDAAKILSTMGSFVGVYEEITFGEERIELKSGDKVILYSDGVFETFNKKGEMYGMKRLKEVINKSRSASPKEIVKNLLHDTDDFWDGESDRDDIAVLAIEFH